MQRILILGPSGSGKTFLGRKIGALLNLKIIHLDYYFWKPNWKTPSQDEWEQTLTDLLNIKNWVMDGNYMSTLKYRGDFADTIIFLECSRLKCLIRCFIRFLKYSGKNRPDICAGCSEKFDWEFFKWIWNYPKDYQPEIFKIINEIEGITFFRLRGKKEIADFLRNLE